MEALPMVEILREESECAIFLLEFQVEDKPKGMPCKLLHHSNCINKLLEIHGSCPICKYQMPSGDRDLEPDRKIVSGEVLEQVRLLIRRRREQNRPSPPQELPDVVIVQEEGMSECAICLVEFQVGEKVKEIPSMYKMPSVDLEPEARIS
ncbi:hypothetical protein H5410_009468 [Solanum commersonii]|uniref:RING-type domain-containing protein n=1 Tax=Solanum commersonii TaxID=4109 RepID=A0A9J6AJM7_SOLCO|nr:hypothetical protein H5410_009468 [Solanum commersonii]